MEDRLAAIADSVASALVNALGRVPPPERIAFVLHDLFGVPYETIGLVVGQPSAGVRRLARDARAQVRRIDPGIERPARKRRSRVPAAARRRR